MLMCRTRVESEWSFLRGGSWWRHIVFAILSGRRSHDLWRLLLLLWLICRGLCLLWLRVLPGGAWLRESLRDPVEEIANLAQGFHNLVRRHAQHVLLWFLRIDAKHLLSVNTVIDTLIQSNSPPPYAWLRGQWLSADFGSVARIEEPPDEGP